MYFIVPKTIRGCLDYLYNMPTDERRQYPERVQALKEQIVFLTTEPDHYL